MRRLENKVIVVARGALFLCSDNASVITGAQIAADAGLTAAQHRGEFKF